MLCMAHHCDNYRGPAVRHDLSVSSNRAAHYRIFGYMKSPSSDGWRRIRLRVNRIATINNPKLTRWAKCSSKRLFRWPEEPIITIGDFERRKHRKDKKPMKGKGFRSLFRKDGYGMYLVGGFRTSFHCSASGSNYHRARDIIKVFNTPLLASQAAGSLQ